MSVGSYLLAFDDRKRRMDIAHIIALGDAGVSVAMEPKVRFNPKREEKFNKITILSSKCDRNLHKIRG